MEKKTISFGFLVILFILVGGQLEKTCIDFQNLRTCTDKDKSTFYNLDDGVRVAARESIKLFDGTTRLYRDVANIELNYSFSGNELTVLRKTPYKRGPVVYEYWVYDSTNRQIAHFPVDHGIMVFNGEGYILEYNVRDLTYTGDTFGGYVSDGLAATSPQEFGYNMKVEWSEGNYWSKVFKSGILKLRYRMNDPIEVYQMRLFDPTLTADGSGNNAKYELQYVINLTAAGSGSEVCIGIDHPDYGDNYSCGAPPHTLLFNMSNLSVSSFTAGDSVVLAPNGGNAGFTLASNAELASLAVNITGTDTGSGFPANITFGNSTTVEKTLIGHLVDDNLFQDEYIFENTVSKTGDILFTRAGIKTFLMTVTSPVENGTFIFNFSGNESNIGNAHDEFDYHNFTDSRVIQANLETNEIGNRLFYDELLDINITDLLWTETQSIQCQGTGCSSSVAFTHGTNTNYVITTQLQSAIGGGSNHARGIIETVATGFDALEYLGFEFNASHGASFSGAPGGSVTCQYFFEPILSDGTTDVILYDITGSSTACTQSKPEQRLRVHFEYDDNDEPTTARVYLNNTLVASPSISSLDSSVDWSIQTKCEVRPGNLNILITNTCSVLDGFNLLGLTLDNASQEGTGNYTSEPVFTAPTNDVTSAILTWTEYVRYNATTFEELSLATNASAVNIDAFLSSDNGTNWQEVQSGVQEVFDNPGTNLKYRFNFTTADPLSVPVIGNIRTQIVPGLLENITIDVGNDGVDDFNATLLNGTNSTVLTNAAFKDSCPGRHEICNVSIKITSETAGLFTINQVNYTHNPNPISFRPNETLMKNMQNVTNPTFTVNFTDGNLTLSQGDLRYWGSGNVTITAEDNVSADDSLILQFRYSRFILTSPAPWFLMTPTTGNSKNVEPFGQRSKFSEPIFTVRAHEHNDDPMNLTFQFNDTLDSCITVFASNETDRTPAYILPNNQSLLGPPAYGEIDPNATRPIYIWGNFTSCTASTARYYDPYNFFNSLCSDCVRNDLQNNTVFI